MRPGLDLTIPASLPELLRRLPEIEAFCTRQNLSAALAMRVQLVVEELASNVIKYGRWTDPQEARLDIHLRAEKGRVVTIVLEDAASPFDPTDFDSEAILAKDAEHRPIGQSGLALVRGMATRFDHETLSPGNRVTVTLAWSPTAAEGGLGGGAL